MQAQRTYCFVCLCFYKKHSYLKYALHGKQILDIWHITHSDKRSLTDAAAAFGIFAHENMAMECATTLDFTSAGNFKAFFRSAIGLDFWHDYLRKK